jgi:transposase
MKRLQAFKFELRPNGAQQRDLRRFAGCCRFVFNKALAPQQSNHESGEGFIGYPAMAKHLTEWRNRAETPWLKCAPIHPLQRALEDLDRAYQSFFAKRADFPNDSSPGAWSRSLRSFLLLWATRGDDRHCRWQGPTQRADLGRNRINRRCPIVNPSK